MMMLNQNKQEMYYALQTVEVELYKRDKSGNVMYITVGDEQVPVESRDTIIGYTFPAKMLCNIAFQSNETTAQEFGVNVADYDAIIVFDKGEYPITETSLIWYESEVAYEDDNKTIVDPNSADYSVVSVRHTLNEGKAILKHVAK